MDDRSQEQVKPVSPASAFGVSSSLLLMKKKNNEWGNGILKLHDKEVTGKP